MSLLAGIMSLRRGVPIPDSTCDSLKRAISRHGGDEVWVYRDARACLMKVDIGVFGEAAHRVAPTGSVSMLAGEPLLCTDGAASAASRAHDLEVLHEAWDHDDCRPLRRAQGVFSAAHYDPRSGTLSLVTDKLGVRPIYYWVGDSYLVFASALRMLEAVPEVKKVMDLRAITEIASFKYPFGTRTPYFGISLIRAAEIVTAREGGTIAPRQYWRWDAIPQSQESEPQLIEEVYRTFSNAISRRLRTDRTTIAFLSGGLDSRCVVAGLRECGVRVHSFNFSEPDSQDRVFGGQFAQQIGSIHHQGKMAAPGDPKFFDLLSEAVRNSKSCAQWPPERPGLVWSGDGGSVGLGHVYMTPEVVALLRQGQRDAAVDYFLQEKRMSVLSRLVHPVSAALSGVLHQGLREEFDDIHCEDAGRDLYLFLLLNDQHRHLSVHFEYLDLHRVELQLPFFDGDLLARIIAIPVDMCLCHRFYTRWLNRFPPAVTSVPWQTYPAHQPCPLPVPQNLAYQWNHKHVAARRAHEKRELLKKSSQLLGRPFPTEILDRQYLRLARAIYRLGLRDYSYVLEAALTYQRYWATSGGQYVLPS